MNTVVKNPMQQSLFVEIIPESLGNDIIEIRSLSNPNKTYKVDVVKGRCSCASYIYSSSRKPCKHLISMGISSMPVRLNTITDYETEL